MWFSAMLTCLDLNRGEGSAGPKEQEPVGPSEEQWTEDKVHSATVKAGGWSEEACDLCMGGAVDKGRGGYFKGGYRPVPVERQHAYQNLAFARVHTKQQHCCTWAQSYGQTSKGVLGGPVATRYSKAYGYLSLSRAFPAVGSQQGIQHCCYHQGKAGGSNTVDARAKSQIGGGSKTARNCCCRIGP